MGTCFHGKARPTSGIDRAVSNSAPPKRARAPPKRAGASFELVLVLTKIKKLLRSFYSRRDPNGRDTMAAEAEAAAHLAGSLLKRLQRCGDISAECCTVACELLGAPLQLLDARTLRPGTEPPLAFFRASHDGAAGLLVLLDLHGSAAQVALHLTASMLASLAADAVHFRVHRQRVTPGKASSSSPLRSAPRAEPFEEAGEWSGAIYAASELQQGELLATVPAHGLLCLRLEPVTPAAVSAADAAARLDRAQLLSSALRLACRPPERSVHNSAAAVLRSLTASDDESRGLAAY
jgi:hypothetical protein